MGIELLAIGAGVLNGASNYMQQSSQISQQKNDLYNAASSSRYQASQLGYQANVMRQGAGIEELLGIEQQEAFQTDRVDLARAYDQEKGTNIVSTASANVDLSSGSALDALTGNAALFAEDMAQNTRNMQLAKWQNTETIKAMNAEATFLDQQEEYMYNQANYYEQVASSLKPSLLQSVFSGASSLIGGIM